MYKERYIFGVQFVEDDKKLNFYKPGNPVHSWYTAICSPAGSECNPVLSNFASINIGTNETPVNTEFEVAMPFHAAHFGNITVDWQTAPVCQTSYLALGITRGVCRTSRHPDAFVVQANSHVSAIDCTHEIRLDEGRKLASWKAVALLAGWRQSVSSLGTVVAISPNGIRVAAVTWSRILVWSLNPGLLHQGELQHYFPVRDYNDRKEFGRLRPTILRSEGVVYNMQWIDGTRLYATTDKGLVRWDIGPMSNGEKEELTLKYDAWSDTAVATPATPHGSGH